MTTTALESTHGVAEGESVVRLMPKLSWSLVKLSEMMEMLKQSLRFCSLKVICVLVPSKSSPAAIISVYKIDLICLQSSLRIIINIPIADGGEY